MVPRVATIKDLTQPTTETSPTPRYSSENAVPALPSLHSMNGVNTPARVDVEHHHRAGNRLAHRPKRSGSPVDRALGPVSYRSSVDELVAGVVGTAGQHDGVHSLGVGCKHESWACSAIPTLGRSSVGSVLRDVSAWNSIFDE